MNPDAYEGRLKSVAQAIINAAQEHGMSVVQLSGQLFTTHTDENGQQYTTRTDAYASINAGYIAISELIEDNADKIMHDALHEITHQFTDSVFGYGSQEAIDFVDNLAKTTGVDIRSKAQKVIDAYSDTGTFDFDVADELISRIAEGDNCGNSFTNEELEKLQQDPSFSVRGVILNLLWNRYRLLSAKTDDWMLRFTALHEIEAEIGRIRLYSGADDSQLRTMTMPVVYEYANLFPVMGRMLREVEKLHGQNIPGMTNEQTEQILQAVPTLYEAVKSNILPEMLKEENELRKRYL